MAKLRVLSCFVEMSIVTVALAIDTEYRSAKGEGRSGWEAGDKIRIFWQHCRIENCS